MHHKSLSVEPEEFKQTVVKAHSREGSLRTRHLSIIKQSDERLLEHSSEDEEEEKQEYPEAIGEEGGETFRTLNSMDEHVQIEAMSNYVKILGRNQ